MNKSTPQVFCYEVFEEELDLFRQLMPAEISIGYTSATIQESQHESPPAEIISTRTQSTVPEDWLPQLRAILGRCTGYDYLKSLHDKHPSLQTGYLPKYCARSVAEQAMLLWSALLRKLPRQIQQFACFERDGLTGSENAGKTLLVVGVGNIGYEIVKIGWGLEMQVLGVDPVKKHPDVQYVTFEDALPRADIIVSAMNLTPQNYGYFSYSRMLAAKPSAVFVNIARGEQSPLADLIRLLEEQRLAGVALDVYPAESQIAAQLRQKKLGADKDVELIRRLQHFPNVILTPHNAFNTAEAVRRKVEQSVQQIVCLLNEGRFIWEVPE